MADNFFFVALPYLTLLLLIGGTAYRAFTGMKTAFRGRITWSARGDLLWTTRSTGFFGRASIGPAALTLHWGLLIVIVTHIVGFIGGAVGSPALVGFFRWGAMFGCMLLIFGATWALVRRLVVPQLRAMSTVEDYIVLVFLIVITALGLHYAVIQMAFGVSYAVGPWLVGLLTLQPDASLISGAPLVIRLHMILAMLFLAYLPFTKLVHAFSFPFAYINRPPISMRRYVGLKQ